MTWSNTPTYFPIKHLTTSSEGKPPKAGTLFVLFTVWLSECLHICRGNAFNNFHRRSDISSSCLWSAGVWLCRMWATGFTAIGSWLCDPQSTHCIFVSDSSPTVILTVMCLVSQTLCWTFHIIHCLISTLRWGRWRNWGLERRKTTQVFKKS